MRSQFVSKTVYTCYSQTSSFREEVLSLQSDTTNEKVNDRFHRLLTQLYRVCHSCPLFTSFDSMYLQAHRKTFHPPFPRPSIPTVSRHTDGFSASLVSSAFIVFVVLTASAHVPRKSMTIWRIRMPAQFHFRSPILSTLLLYILIRILKSMEIYEL